MSLVSVHNEWDPLEEVVVGSLLGGQIPVGDRSLHAIEFSDLKSADDIPSGPFPPEIVDQTELELAELANTLTQVGIKVRRPARVDRSAILKTPDWATDGFFDYCPRDGFLTIGSTIIECPMVLRSRFLESLAYKDLFLEYHDSGAKWISAPKPRLMDDMFDTTASPGLRLLNKEPAFDGANILRFGTDILYLVSDTGNERGFRWLESTLGDGYQVHPCRNVYASSHIDSTIVPLRPGLVLINPSRVRDGSLPEFLDRWDKIVCPDLVDTGFIGNRPACSSWIGMNLLTIGPSRVVADRRQPELIRELERHHVEVIPQQLTHARSLSGGFRCVTLDIRRAGNVETYQ